MALDVRQRRFRDVIWRLNRYTPSLEQQEAHDAPNAMKLVAGGVGAGKSYWLAMEGLPYTATDDGLGWIIGPTYELAKPEFKYILSACEALGVVEPGSASTPGRGSSSFRTQWGFEWVTKSATNEEEIAGRRPHVVLMSEAAQHTEAMMYKAMERAVENDAPVLLSGTFERAYTWYADWWERWQGANEEGGISFSIPTWSNLAKYPCGRNDEKIKRFEEIMPPELFMERFGGVPSKPEGLVFKEFSSKVHVKPIEELFDPACEVELWVDPATHTYAVLFVQIQRDGKTVHVLDEVYAKNQIGQQVIPQVIEKPWWKHSCRNGVIDIAGTFRAGAGLPQIEIWAQELQRLGEHGINWRSTKIRRREDWHDALHLRLWSREGTPLMFFASHLNDRVDADGRANGVLGELKSYRWPSRNEFSSMPTTPIKRNEDALSAAGYGCLFHFGPVVKRESKRTMVVRSYF